MPRVTYNGVTVTTSAERPSSRDDKKFMREVTYNGQTRLVHYGDPNMEIQSDSDERRQAFVTRHNCDAKKDPFAPGFWSCYKWTAGRGSKAESEIDDMDEIDTTKAGRRNSSSDRQRISSIRSAATDIIALTNEMEPAEEDDDMSEEKAVQIDPNVHPGAMVALMLTDEQRETIAQYRVGGISGEMPDHITLLYLNADAEMLTGDKNRIVQCVTKVASMSDPISGRLNGYGRFNGDGESYPVYANYDSAALFKVRSKLLWKLDEMGIDIPTEHGFTPHLTLGYLPTDARMPVLDLPPMQMNFDRLALIWGGERMDFMFFGDKPNAIDEMMAYEYYGGKSAKLPEHRAIKALGGNRVGGYMCLWGDAKTADLDGEYFTPETEEMTGIFKAMGKLPYLYNHAMDDTLKTTVIGSIDVMEPDDIGLWYEAQLNTHEQYRKYVEAMQQMVSKKMLGTSSGTLGGAAKVDRKTGRILRWPIVEGSATPTPADPRQVLERPIAEVKSAFKAVGLDTDKLEQLTSDTAKADTHITDSEPEPEATEPETGAQPVVQGAADGTQERDEQTAKRLSLELELLLLED